VAGLGDTLLPGVANIGTRPTVAGVRQQLEVHLLDVVMDLYGRHIDVVLRKKYATSSDLHRWMSLKRRSRVMS
jgi:riboflavin kinase/FMN adenylyltransferase